MSEGKYGRRWFAGSSALVTTGLITGACALRPEVTISEVPLADSIRFVLHEIEQNQNLPDLQSYGEKRILEFARHGYNIFFKVTGSAIPPEKLLAQTRVVDSQTIKRINDEESRRFGIAELPPEIDPKGFSGKVHIENGDRFIALNREGVSLSAMRNRPTEGRVVNDRITKLGLLLHTVTHEPFHFEIAEKKIQPPAQVSNKTSTIEITDSLGFTIIGRNLQTGKSIVTGNHLEEVSVYLLQRGLIAPVIGKYYEQYPGYPIEVMNAINEMFAKLGYPTAPQLLQRRRVNTGIGLLEDIAPFVPDAWVDKDNPRDFLALSLLNNFNLQVQAGNAQEIRRGLLTLKDR